MADDKTPDDKTPEVETPEVETPAAVYGHALGSRRGEYVESLKVERAFLAGRIASPAQARRLADVDAELDRFAEKPARARRETAVPKN